MADGLLIKQEKYLETGIHIGTKLRTIDMVKFIYRTRNDGLYVLDLRKVDERIRLAGKILSKFDAEGVVVVASRTYSSLAAKAFAQITGAKVISGRFIPGMFTNVARKDFVEPKLVLICDPKGERQAVVECGNMGLSTIGLCDTDNYTMFIDWIIPCNNKGRRSLSLIFWLLAREFSMANGKISSYDDFKPDFEEFEAICAKIAEDEEAAGKPIVDADLASTDSQKEEPEEEDGDSEGSDEPEDGEDDEALKKAKASDKASSAKSKKKRSSKPKVAKKAAGENQAGDDAKPNSDSDSTDEKEAASSEASD